MYFQNAGESKITDILSVTALFLFVALILFIIFLFIFRNIEKAIGISNINMLILTNFEVLSKVFQWLPYRYIVAVILCLTLLVLVAILIKKKSESAEYLNLMIFILFSTLILVNAIPAIPTIYHKLTLEIEKPQILTSIDENSLDKENCPNVYFLIFDEYGGSENLKQYFGYENSDFKNALSNLGFNISDSSRNSESIETVTLVPNLLNISYVANDSMIADERLAYMNEPVLFDVMKYLGYDIITCSSIPFLDNSMSIKNFEEQEVFEDKAGYFVLKNSIFIHAYNKHIEKKLLSDSPESTSYGDVLINAFNYYIDLAENKSGKKPQFCMGYFQTPHVPFFYKKDGSLNNPNEYENWLNSNNYIDYLEWTNQQILRTVESIIEHDRNSIIILQSDHGARYPIHVLELTGKQPYRDDELYYQNNILNCVYYKGELINIEGYSGINTLRFILNQQFHTNFELLSTN